jgi:aryl-alcohol dehydrogenase-like predicted oxidoreductase
MQKAIDSGINFLDTPNVYNKGESKRITGKLSMVRSTNGKTQAKLPLSTNREYLA